MSKALELIRTLIDGANEYEKKTGNKNPTVYLSKNNLLIIQQALLKAQEQEKEHKALEIIKEKDVDVSWLKYCIKENMIVEAYNSGYPEYHKHLTEEEFNLLKDILRC